MTVIYGSATAMDTGKIVQAFGVHGVEEVIKLIYRNDTAVDTSKTVPVIWCA